MKQNRIFLQSEGNAWLQRNAKALASRKLPEGDSVLTAILDLPPALFTRKTRVLEIGCGDGARLAWLKNHCNCECSGIEPSSEAVAFASAKGVDARQGTAEKLPFDSGSFDIVIFGFCLYLCDREDLFRIASEADRVLSNPGWLLILDFFSPVPQKAQYRHHTGLFSYKMDYRRLFDWNAAYVNFSHKVQPHISLDYTDEATEWVATSVMRKNLSHE